VLGRDHLEHAQRQRDRLNDAVAAERPAHERGAPSEGPAPRVEGEGDSEGERGHGGEDEQDRGGERLDSDDGAHDDGRQADREDSFARLGVLTSTGGRRSSEPD